jgi:hypothetical protein
VESLFPTYSFDSLESFSAFCEDFEGMVTGEEVLEA